MSSEARPSSQPAIGLERIERGTIRRSSDFLSGFRRKFYGPITHVKTNSNYIALTFDDGPHPDFTIALLQILKRFDSKATFFMVGQIAARYPDVVKQVAEEGHAIGNHSFTHVSFPQLDTKTRRDEIEHCAEILHPYAQKLFRPPFGLESMSCHRDAVRLGYRVIKWNVSVDDWRDHSADWLAERLMQQVKAGSIVLLHDNVADRPASRQRQTQDAVEKLLNALSGKFAFCTVPQMLAVGKPMTSFTLYA